MVGSPYGYLLSTTRGVFLASFVSLQWHGREGRARAQPAARALGAASPSLRVLQNSSRTMLLLSPWTDVLASDAAPLPLCSVVKDDTKAVYGSRLTVACQYRSGK